MSFNKEFFYILTYDYKGVSSKEIYKMDVYIFNQIALLASSLSPLEASSEIAGHLQSLYVFFENNKEHYLYKYFEKIINNSDSSEFLTLITSLTLIEKQLRVNGIRSLEEIQKYNELANEYQKRIALNNEDYKELMDIKK